MGVNSSQNAKNSPMKPSGPGLLLVGSFKITDSVLLLVTGNCSVPIFYFFMV